MSTKTGRERNIKMSQKKFTDQQIKVFISQTNAELVLQDPQPVLQDLGIEYKELGNDSYRMNIRGEKTPSAYISLKNGLWKYKDFGTDKSGNIVNVVMDYTGKDYKSALSYSLQTLGVPNYLEQALNSKQQDYQLSQADRERIKQQREANAQRESSHPLSKVTTVYEVSTNQMAVDYLASRGIVKIPPQMKVINGEYTNNKGEVKRAFGVGVLTRDGTGADIHFLQKIGDLKTLSLGEKDISFFKNPQSNKVAIFESKMDYAAAYQQMPLDDVNVIIANSVSNAAKVAELLVSEGLTQTPMIFNQNDAAGYRFVADIMQKAEIPEVKSIGYQVMTEYKKDINDLLLEGVKIADRIETRPLEYFADIAASLESIQKAQQTPSKAVTREDLQQRTKQQSQEQEQER
ncbi:toprim domain-containing protein [Sulfurimonas sp.]|uniref:toprim domain-containing protein n=1 Tax=Sulfurimonas sp. TaxID=2022749 RepID=UPI002637E6E2|nr:toprim domain-containing protein [Sulfurimonas sp.]MDD3450693.1 toprim domain-containing protein [Sulfurimonas sp.]